MASILNSSFFSFFYCRVRSCTVSSAEPMGRLLLPFTEATRLFRPFLWMRSRRIFWCKLWLVVFVENVQCFRRFSLISIVFALAFLVVTTVFTETRQSWKMLSTAEMPIGKSLVMLVLVSYPTANPFLGIQCHVLTTSFHNHFYRSRFFCLYQSRLQLGRRCSFVEKHADLLPRVVACSPNG
jgi:hypothetical protein